MKKYIPVMINSPLFGDIPEQRLPGILQELGAVRREYGRGQYIFHAGDMTDQMGLVLSGGVQVIREDLWGNRDLMAKMGPGELFAEVYACLPGSKMGVSVVAHPGAEVLFLRAEQLLSSPEEQLKGRLTLILAEKNLRMSEKLTHVTQRSIRKKLLSYLSAQAQIQGSTDFKIPFSRQQLADYLAVDRSALSAVLCKMRDEGLLEFERRHFRLKF